MKAEGKVPEQGERERGFSYMVERRDNRVEDRIKGAGGGIKLG